MRTAALVLGILGALAGGFLGMKWLSDADELGAEIEAAAALGVDTGEIDSLVTAGWFLVGTLALGILGGIMTFKGNGKVGGPIMVVAAALPAIFAPQSLVFTFLLVIGGVLAFVSKPRPEAALA